MDEAGHRQALRAAARRRAEADQAKREATRALAAVMARARADGLYITEIAREVSLSRPTVYDLLGRA